MPSFPQPNTIAPAMQSRLQNNPTLWIAALWVVGLVVTVVLTLWLHSYQQERLKNRFNTELGRVTNDIQLRFEKPAFALMGVRGMYAASESVNRREFQRYVESRDLAENFDGLRGMGFIERVQRSELGAFIEREQADGAPDFAVRSLGADGADLYVIKFIEPMDRNRAAFGLDLGSEAVRRDGAERAARSGQPTLSGVIQLVQDTQSRPGFLLFVPVYRPGLSLNTPEERLAALHGLVFSPIVLEELLRPDMDLLLAGGLHIQISDKRNFQDVESFYQVGSPPAKPLLSAEMSLFTNNNFLFIQARSTPAFEATANRSLVFGLGVAGALLSTLLAWVLWLQATGRARAETRAQRMTLDLQKLAMVAERTSNAVVVTGANGLIEWVNEGFTHITGYTPQEVVGRKPGNLLQCPETDLQTVARMREALAQRQPCREEILNGGKDGRIYWVDLDIQPLFDDSGQHTGFMAIQSEVTGRRETLEQLKRAVQENESLMSAIDQSTIYSVTDLQGNIVDLNDAFVRISGYRREELIGSNHRVVKSGTQPDEFWRAAWATITSGQIWHGEVCNRSKNGELYWVESTIVPFLSSDGLVEKYISIRVDITAQKRAQTELESQRKRLDNILKGTQAGTWEWHVPSGRAIFNERWADILGHTLQELEPVSINTWTRLVHPDDMKVSDELLQQHFRGELDFFESESRMRHRDGHWVWVQATGRLASREPDGAPGWMYGTHLDVTERKEAENKLRESEERFKGLLDVASDWYWETDDQYRFSNFVATHDTENYRAISHPTLGMRRWEMPGVTPVTSDWSAHIAAHDRRKSFRNFEYRRELPTGEIRYYAISGFPVIDAFGTFKGYRGTTRDATAQKQQEMELQTARDRMELAAESAGIGVWVFDVASNTQQWDDRMFGLYGRDIQPGLLPDDMWSNSLHPEDKARALQATANALGSTQNLSNEFRIVWPNGAVRHIRSTARVQRDDQGAVVRLVGVNIDVTEQRERERKIAAEEMRLRAVYNILPVGISITDPQGHIIDCNPASERMLGITMADHLARAYDDKAWTINREDGTPMPVEEFASVRALTQQTEVHGVVMQVLTDHHSAWLSVSAMPVAHEDFGVVIAYVDITEQKAQADALMTAKTQAEQASLFKSQFLANMSHEIRTPMNAILGMLKLMHNTALQPRQLDYVEKTEGAAKSLLGLLNDILDFSKVEAGKMTLDPQPFALDRLMRDLSVIFSSNLGNKPVEVLFDIDPRVPHQLLGDSLRLQQILINLGGNAIKFTSRGEVVVRVRLDGWEGNAPDQQARVHFAVKDSGIGIAPENQHKIFAGFTQAEASTTRRFGGTGLGLSICRRLIELMGGELQLESAAGQGSTFSFSVVLPVVAVTASAAAEASDAQAALAPWSIPGLPVLVVDDNPVARELMANMGDSLGWRLETADSGEAALALIAERHARGEPYQAVFVDWTMPGLDGWQTSARIRSLIAGGSGSTASPLIMMVTAHGREMLAQQTAEVQNLIDGYLVKPVTASMLFEAMQLAVQPSDVAASARSTAHVAQPLAGLRILLVEDNAINQQVAEELLSGQGAAIDIADNGLRGVEAVQAAIASGKPYDAVLMDMQMPVMDGLTATREIRGRLAVAIADLPIIAMTANAMAGDREVCLAAGMNDHVGKPFDLDRLVTTLLQWARGASAAEAAQAQAPAPAPAPPLRATETEDATHQAEPNSPALLNRKGALQRVGGSTSLLNRLSVQFLADLPGLVQACEAISQPERKDEALRALHSLKGVAATIGADALAKAASEAEQHGKSGLAVNLDPLRHVVAQTQQALLHIGITAPVEPTRTGPTEGESQSPLTTTQREILNRLLPLLEASDLSVFDAMEELQAPGDGDPERWAALDGEVQAMAFDRAAQLVRQWLC
jgi:two-component system sensor histidine kinase/response regulator